jgi:hypothetical protein
MHATYHLTISRALDVFETVDRGLGVTPGDPAEQWVWAACSAASKPAAADAHWGSSCFEL